MTTILKVDGVKKSFDGTTVLNGLSFEVKENTIYGFVGANGAGKTTTMKIILGLIALDEGTVEVMGEKVTCGKTPTNRYIGYVPDVPSFYGYMTARKYLEFCAQLAGIDKSSESNIIDELLETVGLKKSKNKKIGGFSRGMKQRLGIAQALIGSPKLIILDEPTSALDPKGRRDILSLMESIKSRSAVLFSTHILSDVENICDEVGILADGKMALCGNITDIKNERALSAVTLTVAPKSRESIVGALEGFKYIADKDVYNVQLGSKESDELLKILVDRGISLIKYEKAEPTLEDLFMEKTL